ncbi:HAD-IIA family hydrolase [Agromyces sp. SYSU T00194]|uniref:HAD-IIA family hydrolase n=1 Tax=Agromyces chitinivorans TaxID=3158560 RepID=UPI003394EA81
MGRRDEVECWLTDMDGVLVHEDHALPGAAELLQQWRDTGTPFLVLTNNSIFTARDLSARLKRSGLEVPEESIWTSALATADFLKQQQPGGTAFVIGEAGILTALHEAGYIMTESDPDFVVVGETRNYSFDAITKAIRFIGKGSRFIVTNPDATGPSADGPLPATGAIAAMITKATGREPYVVGKPNPMMFRSALNKIGAHSENTAMIGDRMDTDIVAGIEAGLHTILVMTGISDAGEIEKYPFRPSEVIEGVHELVASGPIETEL